MRQLFQIPMIRFRQEVTDIMESCDVIIHAGGCNKKLAEQLEKKKPLYLVRGTTMGNGFRPAGKLWFELEGALFI